MLMAVFFRGLATAELSALTDAMLHSGDVLDLSDIAGVKVDKHSTGGVGDMISLPLAPLAAACGLVVPMISGRGLGTPAAPSTSWRRFRGCAWTCRSSAFARRWRGWAAA